MACLQLLAWTVGLPLLLLGWVVYMRYRSRYEPEPEESWRSIKAPGAPTDEESLPDGPWQDETDRLAREPKLIKPPRDYIRSAFPVVLLAGIFNLVPASTAVVLLVLLAIASIARRLMREHKLARHGETAVATIVDLDVDHEAVSDLDHRFWLPRTSWLSRSTDARLTYRFRVPDRPDEEYEGTFKVGGSSHLAMAIGKQARVRYLPADPRMSALEVD